MVLLITEGGPDLVALQEVPLWALGRLEGWSKMRSCPAVTKRALLGPLARLLHELDPVHVRSPLTGQANALLVGPAFRVDSARSITLNPGASRERRVCQLLAAQAGGRPIVLGNLHATNDDAPAAEAEIRRVAELLAAAERCLVCGDFNVPGLGLSGFSPPLPGIDQILVRGLELVEGPAPWPEERRRVHGRLLSDHAPIEAVIA